MAFPGFPNRGFDAQGNSTDGMSPQEAAMLRGVRCLVFSLFFRFIEVCGAAAKELGWS